MKKKLFFAFMLSVVMAGAWFVVENQTQPKLSDVALANIEALASGEGTHGESSCWSNYDPGMNGVFLRCVTCDFVDGAPKGDPSGICVW